MSTLPRIIKKSRQQVDQTLIEDFIIGQGRRVPGTRIDYEAPEQDVVKLRQGRVLGGSRQQDAPEPVTLEFKRMRLVTPGEDASDDPFEQPQLEAEEPEAEPDLEDLVDPEILTKLRAEWDQFWEIQMDTAVQKAQQEAFIVGYNEGREQFEPELHALRAELKSVREAYSRDVSEAVRSWHAFIEESEPLVLEMAFSIAEAILDAPLPDEVMEVATPSLANAIEALAKDAPLTISVHPVDWLRLQENSIIDQINSQHPALRWDPNATIDQGDWVVQSPKAVVRHIKEELMMDLREKFHMQQTQRHT